MPDFPPWSGVSGGRGSIDHTTLLNLGWTVSGHVGAGVAGQLAGFNGAGTAVYFQIGTDVMPYDAGLASLTTVDGVAGLPYVTGANTWATATLGDLAVSGGSWTVTDLTIVGEARGDLLMRGAASWGSLVPGTAGYSLVSAGPGADVTWALRLADPGSDGMLARTASGTTTARTLTAVGTLSVTNGSGVAGAPAFAFTAPWNPSTIVKWIIPGGTLTAGVGCSVNTSGTVAFDSSDATGPMVRFGNNVSGNLSGLTPSTGTAQVLQTRWGYTVRFSVRTHSDLTSQRLWVGVGNAGASYNSDTPANDIAALRFSTVAGDTKWQLYTSILAGANAVTDTGVTVVADTDYEVVFVVTATSVSVSINGGAATTYSGANVPTSTGALSFVVNVIPQTGSARYIHFRGCSCQPTL